MLVSLNWLKKYADLTASPREIAEALTMLGLEVEEITPIGVDSEQVVSAKVEDCQKHPDADKLSVCRVFDGQETHTVVCGAPNVKAGQTVVFAKVGAVLPGDFKIKKAKIRGVESSGMICAEDEVGLGASHEGIIELDSSLEPGLPLMKIPGLTDAVFELSITPNRPDALSHIGVARELAAHYGLAFSVPAFPTLENPPAGVVSIRVDSPEDCPVYIGRVIRDVKIGPSPDWLVTALERVGQKSINNVVDLTNFVLLEYGHPSHSFDLGKLTGGEISIRPAQKGETLLTLDGENRELSSEDLVIADKAGPQCLAGVIGGENSKVDETTKNIFLEVAYFKPETVRKQARRHQVSTDSSYRFERGVDVLATDLISQYLTSLICELTGGRLAETPKAFRSPHHPTKPLNVRLRPAKVNSVLGLELTAEKIAELLRGIHIQIEAPPANSDLICLIPGFRPDLTREIDLIEEVARLINFNNIPTIRPSYTPEVIELPPEEALGLKVRHHLASLGLNEGLSLRFAPARHISKLLLSPENPLHQAVKLLNPLSEESETLPVSLLHNLLEASSRNHRNQERACLLFEVGKTFSEAKDSRDPKNPGVSEETKIAIVLSGSTHPLSWQPAQGGLDYYTLKGVVESLFAHLKLPIKFSFSESASWLHPGESGSVLTRKRSLGSFGTLHPQVAKNYDLQVPVWAAEFSLSEIQMMLKSSVSFSRFSTQVSTKREMNIVVEKSITHAQVLSWMPLGQSKHLEEVRLNTIYEGPGLPDNHKALNYSFIYRHPDQTLTDNEVNSLQDKIIQKLKENPAVSFK